MKSIAAFFGAAMLFSCENDLQDVKRLTSGLEIPPTEIYKYQSVRTDSGYVTSRIFGGKVVISSADDKGKNLSREISDSLMIIVYKTGTAIPEMIMTSLRGADYPLRQKAEAGGNVIVVNDVGDSLITERLLWDKEKQSIYSDRETTIIMNGDVIVGKKGFWADENMKRTKIFQTEGLISIDDSLKTEETAPPVQENMQQDIQTGQEAAQRQKPPVINRDSLRKRMINTPLSEHRLQGLSLQKPENAEIKNITPNDT